MTQKCPKCNSQDDDACECLLDSYLMKQDQAGNDYMEFLINHPYEIYVQPKECGFVNIDRRIVRFLGHDAFHFLYFLARYCEHNGKKEGTVEEVFEDMNVFSNIQMNKAIRILLKNVMITKRMIGSPKVEMFAVNKDGVRNFLYYATKQLKLEHDQEQTTVSHWIHDIPWRNCDNNHP